MSQVDNTPTLDEETEPRVFRDVSLDSEIIVLAVDDDPDQLDLSKSFLEKERGEFEVITAQFTQDALDYLEERRIDAIVSDYDMPKMDGLEFLDAVREECGGMPFILFTGKGSEEIASEAISKGVTDYLQKTTDASQYSLLANRIVNAVEQSEAATQLRESQEKFSKLVKNSSDMLGIVNDYGEFEYISPACEHILGYEQEELLGENAFEYMPPTDRQMAMEEFFDAIENPSRSPIIEHQFKTKEGGTTLLETRGQNMFDDDLINGFVVNGRDISDLKERERKLKQQNEQLTDMRNVFAHDIRNPLNVISGSLQMYRETENEDHLRRIETSVTRIETLIEQVLTMAKQEPKLEKTEQTALEPLARDAWEMVETGESELHIDNSKEFEADPSRLQLAFENLFRNAIDHNDAAVTIVVGATEAGIYIEDNGTGIPETERELVFESGYTTGEDNTGFGLNIVKQIVFGHGWDIELTESESGGARFDITDVTFQPRVYG